MKKIICFIFITISLNVNAQIIKFEKNDLSDTLKDDARIWTKTEIEPEFPGGDAAWRKFLSENISLENIGGTFEFSEPLKSGEKLTITVNLSFIVRENGNVVDIKSEEHNNNNGSFIKEAIRVVSLTPKWKPASQNGNYVNFYKKIPVKFELKIN